MAYLGAPWFVSYRMLSPDSPMLARYGQHPRDFYPSPTSATDRASDDDSPRETFIERLRRLRAARGQSST